MPELPPREWDAAAYHRVSEPQFAWGMLVLDRLALRGDERVLDAGCGSGRLTAELLGRLTSGSVVGADLSVEMVRAAHATLSARPNAPMADVVCADLLALPFTAEFDAVFSTATFHWVLDHPSLWAELRSVLVRGGRLEAQCGGGANLQRVHARATQLTATAPFAVYFEQWHSPWEFAAPETTETRLARAGFVDVHCWMEQAPTSFRDAASYRSFMKTVVMRPYLSRVSDPALREELLDRMTAMAAADEPPFTLDYWRLNIRATRR